MAWGEMPCNLEIASEKNGKQAVLHKVKDLYKTRGNNCAVRHARWDIRLLGKLDIPDKETCEYHTTKHKHCDEGAFLPPTRVQRARQRQRNQNEAQARYEEQQTNKVNLCPQQATHFLPGWVIR